MADIFRLVKAIRIEEERGVRLELQLLTGERPSRHDTNGNVGITWQLTDFTVCQQQRCVMTGIGVFQGACRQIEYTHKEDGA